MGSPQNSGGVNAVFDDGDDSGDFSKPFKLVGKILQRWFFTRSVRSLTSLCLLCTRPLRPAATPASLSPVTPASLCTPACVS